MKNIYPICSIPIYQCTSEEYQSKINEKAQRTITDEHTKESKGQITAHLIDRYGPWKYNEIVGYLSLYVENKSLYVDHWHSTSGTQVFSSKRKTITISSNQHQILKISLHSCKTNQECHDLIANKIQVMINKLKNASNIPSLKHRYFDLLEFDVICQHLDWMTLGSK